VPSKVATTLAMPVESAAEIDAVRTPRCHAVVLIVPPVSATDGGVGSLMTTRTLLSEA
jgi:hypothetical protein